MCVRDDVERDTESSGCSSSPITHALAQILPCMHSFCSACLAGERTSEGATKSACPVCGLDAAYAVSGAVASDLIAVATAALAGRHREYQLSAETAMAKDDQTDL